MSEAGKCPECGGEMQQADQLQDGKYGGLPILAADSTWGTGDRIIPFYCKNCGFIKLYKKKEKERNL